MRGAIRGYQKPSEAIRSHQKPSEAIRGYQKLSKVLFTSKVLFMGFRVRRQCLRGGACL
jgi:hypothetical protein